jgi:hypothetical protein
LKAYVSSRKNLKKLVVAGLIAIILVSLLLWTVLAPPILLPQSQSSLSNSLFQFAKATKLLNVSDGAGSYSFLMGMDYNETVSPGSPTIVVVFISLVSEQKSSSFLRGVSLAIDNSAVLIDGRDDSGLKSMITRNEGIMTDRLSGLDINQTSGTHSLVTRLIVSTVDVNYIGYVSGNEQVVLLNGTISIS